MYVPSMLWAKGMSVEFVRRESGRRTEELERLAEDFRALAADDPNMASRFVLDIKTRQVEYRLVDESERRSIERFAKFAKRAIDLIAPSEATGFSGDGPFPHPMGERLGFNYTAAWLEIVHTAVGDQACSMLDLGEVGHGNGIDNIARASADTIHDLLPAYRELSKAELIDTAIESTNNVEGMDTGGAWARLRMPPMARARPPQTTFDCPNVYRMRSNNMNKRAKRWAQFHRLIERRITCL